MKRQTYRLLAAMMLFASLPYSFAQSLPATDQRAGPPRTLNTPRAFHAPSSKAEWTARAQDIREQVLVSCGLWPLPEKTPLQAKVYGKIEREGYSVEKVYLQTYPGFYLAGNLYRPRGQGAGPFPAILNPHGHWAHGRLEDAQDGSIPARCINFARQGMIAFSYDMVGYNDTIQLPEHRNIFLQPTNLLWNFSLMGLQTWNSIRALDFLESLPDADKSRLGCTGASGGGTQTFMLGAVDDRLAAQAPNVMVSHTMQGGCLCENAPGLRVDYFNVDIAAAAAPRPQILVAATGDWTKATLTMEGPALAQVYAHFQATNKLRYVRLDFDHNYNQASREQVYGWFGQWLRGLATAEPIPELAYQKEPDADLRVFPDGQLPADALTETQLAAYLIKTSAERHRALIPTNKSSVERYQQTWLPAWRHTMQAAFVDKELIIETIKTNQSEAFTVTRLALGRVGRGDRVPVVLMAPRRDTARVIALLVHPQGQGAYLDAQEKPAGLAQILLSRGVPVLLVDTFLTGESAHPAAAQARDYFKDFFPTYNRTDAQERVQDLLTVCAYARVQTKGRKVVLCGSGRAGLWAMLAAPAAEALVADCDQLNSGDDHALLAQDLFVPGLRKLGGFEGVLLLAAKNPMLLHNTGKSFSTAAVETGYPKTQGPGVFRQSSTRLEDDAIVSWILTQNRP